MYWFFKNYLFQKILQRLFLDREKFVHLVIIPVFYLILLNISSHTKNANQIAGLLFLFKKWLVAQSFNLQTERKLQQGVFILNGSNTIQTIIEDVQFMVYSMNWGILELHLIISL
jgi:hypothetical protein